MAHLAPEPANNSNESCRQPRKLKLHCLDADESLGLRNVLVIAAGIATREEQGRSRLWCRSVPVPDRNVPIP